MKLFITFLPLLLYSINGITQKNPISTTVDQMGLKGKVKYILDSSFVVKVIDNKKVLVPVLVNVYWFDTKGNKETNSTYNGSGELSSQTVFTYNQLGLLTGFVRADKNGKQIQKMTMEYDRNNYVIKTDDFDEENRLVYQTTFEYTTKNGTRTEIKKRNSKLQDSSVVILNPNNTVKSKTWYAENKVVSKNEFQYTTNSSLPIEKKSEFGSRVSITKYDPSGNILEHKYADAPAEIYTYLFNKINNWIECSKYQNGELVSRQVRKITYYSPTVKYGGW